MKGKRYNKKITIKIGILILLIFVSIMIVTGIMILRWFEDNKQTQDIMEKVLESKVIDENIEDVETNSVEKYNIDFEKLKQTNSNVIAWLIVNGTDIDYPVVKTTNNDYYMTHSFDNSYNNAGWVFMDYKNKLDGTDDNMVIYSHNRKDGSMFSTLKNIFTEEWQTNSENFIIPFITENEKAEYQVFSIYKIEEEDYYITTNFKTDNEFQSFIDTIKSRSIKDFNVDVSTEDSILTLSTCADTNKYRVVLHAKKIK